MPANTKIINRRIKSVVNTRKITKAMELVSASKMRKAVNAVLATRPYATLAWRTVADVARAIGHEEERSHPLLTVRTPVIRTLAVLVTSDRGLCGGLNAQMFRKAAEFLRGRAEGSADFITIGKRGEAWLRRRGLPIIASFGGDLTGAPSITKIRPLSRMAREKFLDKHYDEVAVLYTDFVSPINQKPRAKVLLPLRRDSELGEVSAEPTVNRESSTVPSSDYTFEPDPMTVLDRILPRILETQLYQAVLESLASEHSARMLAMKNASESASEMLDDLRFTFNQARQAGITREIAEISAGTAALEK